MTPAMARALRSAFGDATIEDVTVVVGGRSGATLLGVRAEAQSWVVRQPASMEGVARQLACVAVAATSGVAPALRYADPETGITISRRIEGVLERSAGERPGRTHRIAATLRRLHHGPAFPPAASLVETLARFDAALGARGFAISSALARTLHGAFAASGQFAGRAPCHRDLNPGNVLETADAVYLVDWETAGEGDPFVDLAQLGVFGFPSAEARAELLHAYLERAPTADERAHAALARVIALGFYAVGFSVVAAMAGVPTTAGPPRPYRDVLTDLGLGRASPWEVATALETETLGEATGVV